VAAVGIDAETAAKLLALVKADAASRPSGKVRTKAVPAAAEKLGLKVNGTAVKILAGFCGLQTERGAEAGKGSGNVGGARAGAGRPKDSRDRRPRKTRSDAGEVKESTVALAARARASYLKTKSLRATGEELGISAERVRQLINTDG
jgi:hypothetical protein